MGKFIDETGNRYDRLTVIERAPVPEGRKKAAYWLCRCDCGKEIITIGSCLRRGDSRSCGCLTREAARARMILPEGVAASNSLYRGYKAGAKRKNHEFKLTREEFMALTKTNCHYCGAEPTQIHKGAYNGTYTYNGIDRVDSNKGYSIDNVTTCRKWCNQAKSNMTVEEFSTWLDRIHAHKLATGWGKCS